VRYLRIITNVDARRNFKNANWLQRLTAHLDPISCKTCAKGMVVSRYPF
jgi:hypothetical protein